MSNLAQDFRFALRVFQRAPGFAAAAVLTLLGDGLKGWLAVFLAGMAVTAFDAPGWVVAAAALAVFGWGSIGLLLRRR